MSKKSKAKVHTLHKIPFVGCTKAGCMCKAMFYPVLKLVPKDGRHRAIYQPLNIAACKKHSGMDIDIYLGPTGWDNLMEAFALNNKPAIVKESSEVILVAININNAKGSWEKRFNILAQVAYSTYESNHKESPSQH